MGSNDEAGESSHSGKGMLGGDVGNSKGFSLGSAPMQDCNKVGNIPCSSFNVPGGFEKPISIRKGGNSPARSRSKTIFNHGEGSTLRSNPGDRRVADSVEAGDVGEIRLMAFVDWAGVTIRLPFGGP
ncbi:hypothetical protein L1987_54079 [Smallanthus sonchifolius]|uniref:Uncharacterized protein n=1 Tax=Smallanthus sonchifolius TaxID=185202 RepID=A0ACB9E692_9ASTR|nr:hypothetical protein L1987_54079 [Smallanthus sonchifolius]